MPAPPDGQMAWAPDRALELVALGIFVLALTHTFAAKQLERLSRRYPRHAGLFHLLGEVEVVFGFWAIVLVLAMVAMTGGAQALAYAESRNYTEPLFVFVVMVMAASRPILMTVIRAVDRLAGVLPVARPVATAWLCLAAIPLLGSLVTEPAAMTIAALMMAPTVFAPHIPERRQVPGARRALRQRLDRRHAHVVCGTAGADGRDDLAMGQRLDALPVRLESGDRGAGERDARDLRAAQAPQRGGACAGRGRR